MEKTYVGTVISTINSPSPSSVDFVVTNETVHRGQFVEMEHEHGIMLALITNVVKTNKYFERADSVKEFEASGKAILEQFPTYSQRVVLKDLVCHHHQERRFILRENLC